MRTEKEKRENQEGTHPCFHLCDKVPWIAGPICGGRLLSCGGWTRGCFKGREELVAEEIEASKSYAEHQQNVFGVRRRHGKSDLKWVMLKRMV